MGTLRKIVLAIIFVASACAPPAMGGLETLPPPFGGTPYAPAWNVTQDPANRVEEAGDAAPAVVVTDHAVFLLRHEVEDATKRVHPIVEARSASGGYVLWKRDLLRGPEVAFSGLAAKADGSRVFVATTTEQGSGNTLTLSAFDGQSGASLWQSSQPLPVDAKARTLLLSPDEAALYVAGSAAGEHRFAGRFAAHTGALAWWVNIPTPTGASSATFNTAALSADGGMLFAAGSAVRGTDDLYVVAMNAMSGGTRWTLVRDTRAPDETWRGEGVDVIRTSPDGQRILLGGWVTTSAGDATSVVSLSSQTGEYYWGATLPYYAKIGLAVSRDGQRVHTAGVSTETWAGTTLTLSASTGAPLWARTLTGAAPSHPIVLAGRDVVLVATNDFSTPISTARVYTLDSVSGDQRAHHALSPSGRGASMFSAGISHDGLRFVLEGQTGPTAGDGLVVWGFAYTGLPLPELPASVLAHVPRLP